jgi:tetratricopeptide (TPR) repeat protein
MQYMKKAGYDPSAAVDLQETFVRLSADRKSSFIDGLFASHPPSPERVAANKVTLAKIGAEGDLGKEVYAQKVSKLKSTQAAYKAYDEAVKALAAKDITKATLLAKQAIAGEPREARFQELLGDIALTKKMPEEALAFYDKAIKMQPDYFKPHIQSGVALFNMGRKQEAEAFLKRANELLPTAPGHALLGQITEDRGETELALQHYQVAAESNSDIGKDAAARGLRLDLPRNPAKYLQAGIQADNAGNLFAVVQNNTPIAIGLVQVRVVKHDAKTGRTIAQSAPLIMKGGIASGKRNQIAIGQKITTPQEAQQFQVLVEYAEVVK